MKENVHQAIVLRAGGPYTRILIVGTTEASIEALQDLLVAGLLQRTGVRVLALRLLRIQPDGELLGIDGRNEVQLGHRRVARATLYSCLRVNERAIRRLLRRQSILLTSIIRVDPAFLANSNTPAGGLAPVAHGLPNQPA